MHDRGVAEHTNLAPGRNNRRIANRPAAKILQHILLCDGFAFLVVLYIVVGEDPRQRGEIGAHERPVSSFVQRQNLLLVARLFATLLLTVLDRHHRSWLALR